MLWNESAEWSPTELQCVNKLSASLIFEYKISRKKQFPCVYHKLRQIFGWTENLPKNEKQFEWTIAYKGLYCVTEYLSNEMLTTLFSFFWLLSFVLVQIK